MEVTTISLKSKKSKFSLIKMLCFFAVLISCCFGMVACDFSQSSEGNAAFDESGNRRLIAPNVTFNSPYLGTEIDESITGSISWNFSYYAKNTKSVYKDDQYLGTNFYYSESSIALLEKESLSTEEQRRLKDDAYTGEKSAIYFNGTNWCINKADGSVATLYRAVSTNITFPDYEIVVDGSPIRVTSHIDETVQLYQTKTTASGKTYTTLNPDAIYFTQKVNGETKRLPSDYIRVAEDDTATRPVQNAEAGIPFNRLIVVFNPMLKGKNTDRTIKVKAIAKTETGRGDSAYSSVTGFKATRLAFSVYSPNSADSVSNVGFLEYDKDIYYFAKQKVTVTANPDDAKITYLEGYFPEGRIVRVNRKTYEGSDYALGSWTTNSQAKFNPSIKGTLPLSIAGIGNFVTATSTALVQNDNTKAFIVNHFYLNQAAPTLSVLSQSVNLTTLTKNNLFYEKLGIADTAEYTDPTATLIDDEGNEINLSTLNVCAHRALNGYTFYANFNKVKNFTQSGSVFAGDEFFNGNKNHDLTGYTLSLYIIGTNESGYTKSNDVYTLDAQKSNYIYRTTGSNVFDFTTESGRNVTIGFVIDGSSFRATGLEHNMAIVFEKASTQTGDNASIKTNWSFHNVTMSNVLIGEAVTKALFVAQSDKTLAGIIGTEYADSSNIIVNIKKVTENGTVVDASSPLDPTFKYEIIKSVTTKEDIHGYVTTNIILSVIVPENHLLVSYNVETPSITSCVYYTGGGFDIIFNSKTGQYLKAEKTNAAGAALDETGTYVTLGDNIYTYSYRDSNFKAGVTTYNSYYYGNYTYNADKSVKSFDCVVVSTVSNATTFTLIKNTVLSDFNAHTIPVKIDDGYGGTKDEIFTIRNIEDARNFLNAGYVKDDKGNLCESGVLECNTNTNKYTDFSDKLFFFKLNADNTYTVVELTVSNTTNGDISSNVTAYKSNLTFGNGTNNQQVYFYYDIMSVTKNGTDTYYYTAPIGKSTTGGNVWFYDFNYTNNPEIVLGKTILNSPTAYQEFYNLLGEKIVSNYFYYVRPVTQASVQIRQYSTRGEAEGTLTFYYTENFNGHREGDEYADDFEVQVEYTADSIYNSIEIAGTIYKVYFDPTTFTFKITDSNGTDLSSLFNLSFNLGTGGELYFANSTKFVRSNSLISHLATGDFKFEDEDSAALNFFKTGTYKTINNDSGYGLTLKIGYVAISRKTGQAASLVTYNGNWIIDGTTVTDVNDKYFIFPTFTVNEGAGETSVFLRIALLKDGVPDEANAKVVTTNNLEKVAHYYFLDALNTRHNLRCETTSTAYITKREAFILDKNTNQKTQVMVWGKFVPTSNPDETIIYPSFSSLLSYNDTNCFVFDYINGYYYNIDYSSEKAIREGYPGSYWLSGSPYPNPVLYFSVRHKINELAEVNLSLDVKKVFYTEVLSTQLSNSSSSLIYDFSTYSFKDTIANIDANDYINNVYFALSRKDMSLIDAYKLTAVDGGGYAYAVIKDADGNIVFNYADGVTLKVNEIFVDDDGNISWTDEMDANGHYSNRVYIKTQEMTDIYVIGDDGKFTYFKPLKAEDCYIWKTSKKEITNVGYFDIHGYTVDKKTGTILFNSGELGLNDVCGELDGLTLGNISNLASDYNYDEVVISGVTRAYRTSANVTRDDLYGYAREESIPILDSYDTKETYFLFGKEKVMLVADPIVNAGADVYYRFKEWVVYSRYNSGIIYYDNAENQYLAGLGYKNSNIFAFLPENAGRYVILPVYQRVFSIDTSTEVENGPLNQGGSVIVYYKDGASVDIKNAGNQDVFTLEYLKTEIGGRLGYYYNNIEFTPFVYVKEAKYENGEFTLKLNKLTSVLNLSGFGIGKSGYLVTYIDDDGNEVKEVINKLSTIENKDTSGLFKLTHENVKYFATFFANVSTNVTVDFISEGLYNKIGFAVTCENRIESLNVMGPAYKYQLSEVNNQLYIVEDVSDANELTLREAPIAKLNNFKINVVNILSGKISSEFAGYFHNSNNDLIAGELGLDEDGKLNTRLMYKTGYYDRGSNIMLSALPDEGYRLLGWYDELGNSLYELYGEQTRTYNESDKILRAYKYNGNYYYKRTKNADGSFSYSNDDLVPSRLLYTVRGLYINTGTSVAPNYIEVFYSAAKDAYYYDSAYTIAVDKKYTHKLNTTTGDEEVIVKEMAHFDAITKVTSGDGLAYYFLNSVQVYMRNYNEKMYDFGNTGDDGTFDYYRAVNSGNVRFEGNNLVILSLHCNVKFTARFKEVYQSMIMTDGEFEGITVEAIYYYNAQDNSQANRLDNNLNVVEMDPDNIANVGKDITASSIDSSLFKLFDLDDPNMGFYSATIRDLINQPKGYVALSKTNSTPTAQDNAWSRLIGGNGLVDAMGNAGKRAVKGDDESFALTDLYFDTETTVLMVVKTLASAPLQLHTLGIPSDFNVQPIIFPTADYITENASKRQVGANQTGAATDYRADYLYYLLEVTYNRDPENDYADLIVHPTREISVVWDILMGNYSATYGQFFDTEISYTGRRLADGVTKTNTLSINLNNYFDFNNAENKFTIRLKDGKAADFTNILRQLTDEMVDHDLGGDFGLVANLINSRKEYSRLVDLFIEIEDILKAGGGEFSFAGVRLNQGYLNSLPDEHLDDLKASIFFDSTKNEWITAGLDKISEIYDTLSNLVIPNDGSRDEKFKNFKYDPAFNNRNDYSQDTHLCITKFVNAPVGDGSVNIINLTAIEMFNFSISSITIDGYDKDGNIIYSNENAHPLGTSADDNSFVFYTSVGTNDRTYMGGVNYVDGFGGLYYNGSITTNVGGIQFTRKYIDRDPDYQTNVAGLPKYAYRDFLLAENTLLLFEGLASQSSNEGYDFMGWYQQKRIHDIYDRYFDKNGVRLNVINFNENSDYELVKRENGTFAIYKKGKDGKASTPVKEDKNTPLTQRIFFINEQTLELFYADGTPVKIEGKDASEQVYDYREWTSLELVSTSYRHPFVALANADTIITAMFKRFAKLNFQFDPTEFTVNSSASIDSLSQPLKYSLIAISKADGTRTPVDENKTKQEIYETFYEQYNLHKDDYSFVISILGAFYIDATPTYTLTPVGGYRLDGVFNAVTTLPADFVRENVVEFDDNNNTIIKYSPVNSLGVTDMSTTLINVGTEENPILKPVSTYDELNLVGIIYATVSINHLFANLPYIPDGTATQDASTLSTTLIAKAQRVTLLYTKVEGYVVENEDTNERELSPYHFLLSNVTGLKGAYTFGENDRVYFNSKLFFETVNVLKLGKQPALTLGLNNIANTADIVLCFANDFYGRSTGFIDEWLVSALMKNKIQKMIDDTIAKILEKNNAGADYTFTEAENAQIKNAVLKQLQEQYKTVKDIETEIRASSEFANALAELGYVVEEEKDPNTDEIIRPRVVTGLTKTDAQMYYFVEISGTTLAFYGYFDNTKTDDQALYLQTSLHEGSEEKAIDHWYINAQTPSTISYKEGKSLNEDAEFPTEQEIKFEYAETDPKAELNGKFVLSKENLTYHLRAIIKQQERFSVGFAFARSLDRDNIDDSTFMTLLDMLYKKAESELGEGATQTEIYAKMESYLISGQDRTFENLIKITYSGVKYEALSSDKNIETSEDPTNTNVNGSLTTKHHEGRYDTATHFVLSIENRFVVINQTITVEGKNLVTAGDVYEFVGWANAEGNIISTALSIEVTEIGTYQARFVKTARIDFINENGTQVINMKNIEIANEAKIQDTTEHLSQVFGYYDGGAYYYALVGFPVSYTITPDDGFIIKEVSKKGLSNETFIPIEAIDVNNTTKAATYEIKAIEDSVIKINTQPGYMLTVDQMVFSDYMQTTAGTKLTAPILYTTDPSIKESNIFAKGTKIKLTFNAGTNPYKLIGWYVNNVKVEADDDGAIEVELNENTVVELRVLKTITVILKASTDHSETGTVLSSVNAKVVRVRDSFTLYNGSANPSYARITNILAGEKLNISAAFNNELTFKGWYYLGDTDNTPISTNSEFEFAINGNNPNLNANNEITLVAVFAFTKTITISKNLNTDGTYRPSNETKFDVMVEYTNVYGEIIQTTLGSSSSITINVLNNSSSKIKVTAIVDKNYVDKYFFQYYSNDTSGTSAFSYEEIYEVLVSNLTYSTISANFTQGRTATFFRRMNDNLYTGTDIVINVNYSPSILDGKTLDGTADTEEGKEFVQLGFTEKGNATIVANAYINTDSASEQLRSHLKFIGWFIDGKEASSFTGVTVNGNTITITDPYNVAMFKPDTNDAVIEARYAQVAKLTFTKTLIGGNANSADAFKKITANLYYNNLVDNKVAVGQINLRNEKTSETVETAYLYSYIALSASRYAGFKFLGFKVYKNGGDGEFITDGAGKANTADVVRYFIGETGGQECFDYKIEAVYGLEYTLNMIGVNMGGGGEISFTGCPATVGAGETVMLTSSGGQHFIGYYAKKANGEYVLISDTENATFDGETLINDYGDVFGNIIIEARYTKMVNINVEAYDRNGNLVNRFNNTYPYGVEAKLTAPADFKAWALANADGTNRLYAYYSTKSELTILPLEDKTYYCLCDTTVTDIGPFNFSPKPKTVLVEDSTGLIPDGTTYTPLAGDYLTQETNGESGAITSYGVSYEAAIKAGYMFIGWVAGLKYIVGEDAENYHFMPFSNALTISAENMEYYDIFAVFVKAHKTTIKRNGTTHAGSFNFTFSTSPTSSSPSPVYTEINDNGDITIYTAVDGTLNITAVDGYELVSNVNDPTVSTIRIVKDIKVGTVINPKTTESRVSDNGDNDNSTASKDNTLADSYDATQTPSPSSNIDFDFDATKGLIKTYSNTDATSTDKTFAFDNILTIAKPNEGYFLARYEVTTHLSNGAENSRTIYHHRNIPFVALYGFVSVKAVFMKAFNIAIDNANEPTNNGDINVKETTTDTDTVQHKTVEIKAKEGYRIAGLIVDDQYYKANYGEGFNGIPNAVVTPTFSDPDQSKLNQTYITGVTLEFAFANDDDVHDIKVTALFVKVITLDVYDGRTLGKDDGTAPKQYLLYTDAYYYYDGTIPGQEGINHVQEYINGTRTLIPTHYYYLVGSTIQKLLPDSEGELGYDTNPANQDKIQDKFLGFYYNNTVLPDNGDKFSEVFKSNNNFTIIATFNEKKKVDISFGLFDSEGKTRLNGAGIDNYKSKFNTPTLGLLITKTALKSVNGSSDDVETTDFLADAFTIKNLEYFANDNLVLNAKGNGYWIFEGWYNAKTGALITKNGAFNPNAYEDVTEVYAKFNEEVRKIIVSMNYDLSDNNSNIYLGKDKDHTNSVLNILADANKTFDLTTKDGSVRRACVQTETIDTKTYITITYSIASVEKEDAFYISDARFTQSSAGKPYQALGVDASGTDIMYKFKNFTGGNGNILSGYTYVKGGSNNPFATVNLSEFYQNQTLNLNATQMFSVQFIYALLAANNDKVNDITLTIRVNGLELEEIRTSGKGHASNASDPLSQIFIQIWVEEGDVVTIDAPTRNLPFNTIGYSTLPLVTKVSDGEYLYDALVYEGSGAGGFTYRLADTGVTGITLTDWKTITRDKNFGDVSALVSFGGDVESVSTYTYIAKQNMSFVADYAGIFSFNRKYINAAISASDALSSITNGILSPNTSSGTTFGIDALTPNTETSFVFKSNTSTVLDILDRNNTLIRNNKPGETTSTNLTYYYFKDQNTLDEDEETIQAIISSRQTNKPDDQISADDGNFTENGLKFITEQLGNITLTAGYTTPTLNSLSNRTGYVVNRFKSLYDELTALLADKSATKKDITNLISRFNQLEMGISSTITDKYSDSSSVTTTQNAKAFTQKINGENQSLNFISQDYVRVGSTVTLSAKSTNSNWFFKGFVIVNSASTSTINPFAEGKKLEEENSYISYKIVPYLYGVSNDLQSIKYDEGTRTYTLDSVVAGDMQVVALYEKALIQVEVRLKNLTENLQKTYNDLLAKNSNDKSALEGQRLAGVDLDNDPTSSSGRLSTSTISIVADGEPAIISTKTYPFSQFIGWASDNYTDEIFYTDGGNEPKTIDEIKAIYADSKLDKLRFDRSEQGKTQLFLVNPENARNNLYVYPVNDKVVVGAYFAPMSYVISFEIEEVDVATDINRDQVNQTSFVSIIDTEGEDKVTRFIETMFDENGNRLSSFQRVKSSLISVERSLIPEAVTDESGNPIVDANGEPVIKYYLKYKTGEYVYRKFEDRTKDKIEIIPNSYSTGKIDDEGNAIMQPITLNSSNFYRETNITLFNSSVPSNYGYYFETNTINGPQTTIKRGLIQISLNNKKYLNINDLKPTAYPINSDGDILNIERGADGTMIVVSANIGGEVINAENLTEAQKTIANWRVNYIVSALPKSGFPTVKVKLSNPTYTDLAGNTKRDTTITPFTFDDSDYIKKLQALLEANGLDDISMYDRNANRDISLISGFYNRAFASSKLLTDPTFKFSDCNFTLKLLYAREATKLVAKVSDTSGKSIIMTSRGSNKNISYIQNNLSSYTIYVLENGAFVIDKLTDALAIMGQTKNTIAMQQITTMLEILQTFAKTDTFKNITEKSKLNGRGLFEFYLGTGISYDAMLREYSSEIESAGIANYQDFIQTINNILRNYTSVEPTFDLSKMLKIRVIDVFGWFTGTYVSKSATALVDELIENNTRAVDLYTQIANDCEALVCPDGDFYQPVTSENFTSFYLNSGDCAVTHVELAAKFQEQQNLTFNKNGSVKKAIRPYLYYNEASLGYEHIEKLGALTLTYSNSDTLSFDQETNEQTPNNWQKLSNFLSSIFTCGTMFQGTFVTDLVGLVAPMGRNIVDLNGGAIVSNITINTQKQIAAMVLPFWQGNVPTGEWAEVAGDIMKGALVALGVIAVVAIVAKCPPLAPLLGKLAAVGKIAAIASAVGLGTGAIIAVGSSLIAQVSAQYEWTQMLKMKP